MAIVTIGFAKAHLLHLIHRALRGEEIVIARGSKPLVRLVAIDPSHPKKQLTPRVKR
jgi:antitoxin (DNA-binding transcriptional repressor) of toxin-antitoxin stability system